MLSVIKLVNLLFAISKHNASAVSLEDAPASDKQRIIMTLAHDPAATKPPVLRPQPFKGAAEVKKHLSRIGYDDAFPQPLVAEIGLPILLVHQSLYHSWSVLFNKSFNELHRLFLRLDV